VHALLAEYMSFIILLFVLYVVAGSILITGTLRGGTLVNAGILLLGTAMASIVGATGAAMILLRPLIRSNAARKNNARVVIFFIFLVANIGGALSPLGDPPLFVGFLHGVDFFWTTTHLGYETTVVAVLVLAIFLALDIWLARAEPKSTVASAPLGLRGLINLPLIAATIGAILLSAAWKPGIDINVYGTPIACRIWCATARSSSSRSLRSGSRPRSTAPPTI
jgi:Na+/H+ antiporter NhaD/arsenite permease-like protein